MPPPTLQVTLDPDAQTELERRYHTTRDAETRTRYQMVLLCAQDHTPPQIAQLVQCSADTVRRVLKRYLAGDADAVPHRPSAWQSRASRSASPRQRAGDRSGRRARRRPASPMSQVPPCFMARLTSSSSTACWVVAGTEGCSSSAASSSKGMGRAGRPWPSRRPSRASGAGPLVSR